MKNYLLMKKLRNTSCFEKHRIPLWKKEEDAVFYFTPARKRQMVYPLVPIAYSLELFYAQRVYEVEHMAGAHYRRINAKHLSIEYILDGTLAVRQNGRGYLLERGEIFLMHPGLDNEYLVPPGAFCRKCSITIHGILLPDLLEKSGLIKIDVLPEVDTVKWEEYLRQWKELSGKVGSNLLNRNSELCYSALNFLRDPRPDDSIPQAFRELLTFLENNPGLSVSLEEMAARTGLTKNYLVRRFKQYYGVPPYRKLLELRLERAAHLLLTREELSVKEVTEMVGFRNALNFSTAFRKYFGMPPVKYRQNGRLGTRIGGTEKTPER